MPRIAQRIGWPTQRDRGGVATIVAVLLAGGVLIGMTALVVDVGRFYMEREELQSGADAAAYEIAMDCVKNRPACAPGTVDAAADAYANKNAKDGYGDVLYVCGFAPDHSTGQNRLPGCDTAPAPAGNLTDCMGTVPAGVKFVEVGTRTEIADGTTALPPSFAGALVPGYDGTTVGACSRVAWGPPARGVAFTFSLCEWNAYVPTDANGDPVLAPPPPAVPDKSFEHAIVLHDPDPKKVATCKTGEAGSDLPGGFGWTDENGGDCQVLVDSGGQYGVETGVPPSNDCEEAIVAAYKSGEPQAVPIYQQVTGMGTKNGVYTLKGFTGFVVTGYNLRKMGSVPARLHGEDLCKSPVFCIYGYFTSYIESGGEIGTGEDMGVTVIKTIG